MVGQRIKAYLKENGIMQSFLSEKIGLPDDIVSKMLAGTRKIEVTEYYQICQALKVPFETFLSDNKV